MKAQKESKQSQQQQKDPHTIIDLCTTKNKLQSKASKKRSEEKEFYEFSLLLLLFGVFICCRNFFTSINNSYVN